jgi:hypothetical protein
MVVGITTFAFSTSPGAPGSPKPGAHLFGAYLVAAGRAGYD